MKYSNITDKDITAIQNEYQQVSKDYANWKGHLVKYDSQVKREKNVLQERMRMVNRKFDLLNKSHDKKNPKNRKKEKV